MRDRLRVWGYKDSNRMYWRIEAWSSGESEIVIDDEKDWKWDYRIFQVGIRSPIHNGQIIGQSDHPPRLEHFLLDWLSDINSLVVGAVQRATLENEYEP